MQKRPLSSEVAFLALSAIGVGLLDAALVTSRRLGAAGAFEYVPARLFAIAPLCWLAVAAIVAIPAYVLFRRRGALVTAALLAAMFAGMRL
ncbi:MAG TPA: hypothetical protein VHL59_02220, partial [Thermoanaerobaculia bacterium]|nr:hypothetical protein [Thermoanaerobaculia bacterium]